MTDACVDCLDIEAVIDLIKGIPQAATVEAQIWAFRHANEDHGKICAKAHERLSD